MPRRRITKKYSRTPKRSYGTRRRRTRRSYIPRTVVNRSKNNMHWFKQSIDYAAITTGSGVDTYGSNDFRLSDLPNANLIQQTYNFWRIKAIKITYFPEFNQYQATSTGGIAIPEFYSVLDFNGNPPPTVITELLNYPSLKRTMFNKPHSRYFRPRLLNLLYGSGGSEHTYGESRTDQWVSTLNTNLAIYYGIRWTITASDNTTLPAMKVKVTATYYYQCKDLSG